MAEEPLITLNNALIQHRGRRLLGPISLELKQGDFVGVLGPNGAGKTTLLRALAGVAQLNAGHRHGTLTAGTRPPFSRNVGFLLQRHELNPFLPFTVEDVVRFGRIHGAERHATPDETDPLSKAMDAAGVTAFRRRLYRELSGGEQQKVQIARLIAQEAPVLLLDEPTAGLDLDWQEKLTELVACLHADGQRTVVMVTHDVGRLPACCTHVVMLQHGRIIAQGSPGMTITDATLSDLYRCPMTLFRKSDRAFAFPAASDVPEHVAEAERKGDRQGH